MAQQQTRAPFSSCSPFTSQITCAGPMSYNSSIHGSIPAFQSTLPATPFPALADPSTLPPEPTYYDISVATHKQIATLQTKLDQKLGPEYISQRPGPGGGPKLIYAEGWKIINLANEVFGFNGWSSSICSLTVDYMDPNDEGRRWSCGVSAVVRVTLRDGVYHEDVGYGVTENVKSKGAALDKCKKEAVTDAIKRTLRNFGNLLGNCLYDKQYTQEIVKIKVQPPKLDRSALHRRPEFKEGSGSTGSSAEAGMRDGTTYHAEANAGAGAKSKVSVEIPGSREKMPPPAPQHSIRTDLREHVKAESSIPHPFPPTTTRQPPGPLHTDATKISSIPVQKTSAISANASSVDTDEASYFNSEDDALFMQLDMEGVGSVELEEDRPIDDTVENDLDEGTVVDVTLAGPMKSGSLVKNEQSCGPSATRRRPSFNVTAGHYAPQAASAQQEIHSHLEGARQQQHSGQYRASHHPPQHNQNRHRPSHPQQQLPQRLSARNQQQHLPDQTCQHVEAPGVSPVVMGGFHFPPGVEPSSRLPTPLSGPLVGAGSGPTPVVGMKRGAETMSSGGTPSRGRMMVSHGDASRQARNFTQEQKPREPLAPLEVGVGGDVKRVRR